MIRLGFALRPFLHLTWASAAIEAVWAERLSRVRRSTEALEQPSAWAGILPARVLRIYPFQEAELTGEAASLGLGLRRLPTLDEVAWEGVPDEEVASGKRIRVLVGSADAVDSAMRAQAAADLRSFQRAIGTPDCCTAQLEGTRRQALHSPEMAMFLSIVADPEPGQCIELEQDWRTNAFWHGLGVRLLPHLPCSIGCPRSREIAGLLRERMRAGPLAEEGSWLEQMLSWSLSWSALHGIAELKTPLFKASTSTDATAHRHELRLLGTLPEEAAVGVSFPFRAPAKARRPLPAPAPAL